jgi:hypothetical protein
MVIIITSKSKYKKEIIIKSKTLFIIIIKIKKNKVLIL